MVTEEKTRNAQEKETGRIEAFSDGVFAIAVTLLVLEVKVPSESDLHDGSSLLQVLGHQWPSYLALATSFFTVLVLWINHHNFLRQIARSDHTFLLLNGFLLFWVTVVPFPTNLVAEYLRHSEARTAAFIYATIWFVLSLSFNAQWRYAIHDRRLLARDADRQFIADTDRRYRFGPYLYLLPMLLAFVNATLSFGICILYAIFFVLPTPGARLSRRRPPGVDQGERAEER